MRIYLLRHGETDWNVERRIQGHVDIALNSNGAQQAQQWKPFFDQIHLAGVYSSALSRAMTTAVLASGRAPCVIEGLNERHYGEWEGRFWCDLARQHEDFDRHWRQSDSVPPGGESRFQMRARVYRAMDSILASHDASAEILIVAHGGSGKAILSYANKMSIEDLAEIPPLRNAAMTLLSRKGEDWIVEAEVLPDDFQIVTP